MWGWVGVVCGGVSGWGGGCAAGVGSVRYGGVLVLLSADPGVNHERCCRWPHGDAPGGWVEVPDTTKGNLGQPAAEAFPHPYGRPPL